VFAARADEGGRVVEERGEAWFVGRVGVGRCALVPSLLWWSTVTEGGGVQFDLWAEVLVEAAKAGVAKVGGGWLWSLSWKSV